MSASVLCCCDPLLPALKKPPLASARQPEPFVVQWRSSQYTVIQDGQAGEQAAVRSSASPPVRALLLSVRTGVNVSIIRPPPPAEACLVVVPPLLPVRRVVQPSAPPAALEPAKGLVAFALNGVSQGVAYDTVQPGACCAALRGARKGVPLSEILRCSAAHRRGGPLRGFG